MGKSLQLKKLKRYTHLPQLLHMLRFQKITVMAPATWEDRNDTYFLDSYRAEHPEIKSLLALCMTDAADTYHHWRVYAGAPSGVRIRFNPQAFEEWVRKLTELEGQQLIAHYDRVKYLRVDDFKGHAAGSDDRPFLKRMAFRDEDEIRLIVEDHKNENLPYLALPFDLTIIEEIKLSPWLAEPLVETVIETLANTYSGPKGEWEKIKVRRTSLLANPKVMRPYSR